VKNIVRTLSFVAAALALAACAAPATPVPSTEVPVVPAQPTVAATAATAKDAPPAVQFVPLQEGTTFAVGQEIGVAVLCADSDGIQAAGMTVDSEVVSNLQGNNQTIFQGTLTWTPDKPGQFKLGVIAYDTAGQVAKVAVRDVVVVPAGTAVPPPAPTTTTPAPDTVGPSVSIADMASDWTNGSDVAVSVNAVDASGVVKLELYIDGGVVATWNYDAAAGPAPQSAFATLTWPNAQQGDHTLYVAATDTVGNVGQTVEQTVTVLP
jgi:hypothetical protein